MGIFSRRKYKESPVSDERGKPKLKETGWANDSFFARKGAKFEAYNPDELVARKGADIYRKMLRDPQVKAAFNLIIDIITSRTYRFEKSEDTPEQQKIEDFFNFNINSSLRGTWTQSMRTVLMAKAYGYSVSEKLFCVGEFEGKDHWLLAGIKGKPFDSFNFFQDSFGNINGLEQNQGSINKKLDYNKFIIYINSPELDPIFGESDLRASYRSYWEKDNILKFWNIYLERLAGGLLVATPDQNATTLSASDQNTFDSVLSNVSQGTSMRMPAGWNLDVVHGPSTQAFEEAVTHRDRQIAKSLLVPNLLGFSEQGAAGSFAQSQTQLDTFLQVVSAQGEQLADALNEQLFRELAWWNFGVKEFPRFTFDDYTVKQKRDIADSWISAVDKGVVINTFNDEQRTRELLLYDNREEDEEPLENPNTGEEQTADVKNETVVEEKPTKQEKKDGEVIEASEDIKCAATNVPSPSENITPPATSNQRINPMGPVKQERPESNNVPTSQWTDRLDFVEIEESFDKNEDKMVDDLGVAVDLAYDELVAAMDLVIRESPDKDGEDTADKDETDLPQKVAIIDNSITPATKSAMNQAIKASLRASYEDGRSSAQGAIDLVVDGEDVNASMKSKIKLASRIAKRVAIKMTQGKEYQWSVLDFNEGLRKDTAEKYFAAKAFEITGALTEDMIEKAKATILNGIKNELSIDEIIVELNDVIQGLIGKIDPETGQPDKQERARLETIARTTISDSFNQASLAVYTDPDLGDFVEAYQYSAIIDSRTTDFCESYNNRIFLKSDGLWKHITPPNHFNCRSTLIPLTVLDEYTVSDRARKSDGDLKQPGNGFGTVRS